MSKYINWFWIAVTAILSIIVLICLFPIMYSRYGLVSAILLGLLVVFGMSLYYIRGYWISTWISKKKSGRPNNPSRSGSRDLDKQNEC